MPLMLSFELSDDDLLFFKREMDAVRKRAGGADEAKIVDSASQLLEGVLSQPVPDFVRARVEKLGRLIQMLGDAEWGLASRDRERVVSALAYFAEPLDLIPDRIPGLGYMDDAIMVELVARELRHEIEAYDDFCRFRARKEKLLGAKADGIDRERWLGARRRELHKRMRRRRRGARAVRRDRKAAGGRSPFSLW